VLLPIVAIVATTVIAETDYSRELMAVNNRSLETLEYVQICHLRHCSAMGVSINQHSY